MALRAAPGWLRSEVLVQLLQQVEPGVERESCRRPAGGARSLTFRAVLIVGLPCGCATE